MTTRDASNEQEVHIARILGGKITPNSGGTKFGGGDVLTKDFLIEAKTSMTFKNSFSIKKDWIKKMDEQAFEQGRLYSALAFQFEPGGDNYYVIDEVQFKEFVELIEGMR